MKMKKIRSARSKEKTEKRVSVNFTPTEYAHFLTMKEEKLNYLYFRPITFLKGKWNDQQKKELIDLSLKLSPQVKNAVLQNSLKYFAEEIRKY